MTTAPVTLGTDVAVRLHDLVGPESAQIFMELVNSHRSVMASYRAAILDEQTEAWTAPSTECGAFGCRQSWPCSTRQALNIVEALVEKAASP